MLKTIQRKSTDGANREETIAVAISDEMCWTLGTVFVTIFTIAANQGARAVPAASCVNYARYGDYNLGGIFSVHLDSRTSEGDRCSPQLYPFIMYVVESMVFAIDEINSRTDILPNVTLGFDIRDDCLSEDLALWTAMSLIHGPGTPLYDHLCPSKDPSPSGGVIGIVGPGRSSMSLTAASVADLFQVPMISYAATSDELSDKVKFPFFLRSVAPDRFQVDAIIDILDHFRWDYISIIYSTDEYGINGARLLQQKAEEYGICVWLSVSIRAASSEREVSDVVQRLKKNTKSKVTVMFAVFQVANAVLSEGKRLGLPSNMTWIASDAWGHRLAKFNNEDIALGGLFIDLESNSVPIFEKHFKTLTPDNNRQNPWFDSYWKYLLSKTNCSRVSDDKELPECILASHKTGFSSKAIAAVMDAVYALAYALDSLLDDVCSGMMIHNCRPRFNGTFYLDHLNGVNFQEHGGWFLFEDKGDPPGNYEIKNLQPINGEYRMVPVGKWDAMKGTTRLTINESRIYWAGGQTMIPESICREKCGPGYIPVPLSEACCWGCHRCRVDAIVVNGTQCEKCPKRFWPDANYTRCEHYPEIPVSTNEPVILVVILLSGAGIILTILAVIGMLAHWRHPRIKASSRELSYVNLAGLILAYLTIIPLVVRPSNPSCSVAQTVISVCLTLTFAPTLLKCSRIFRIFRAGKRSTQRPRFISPKEQILMVSIMVGLQLIISCLSAVLPEELSGGVDIYTYSPFLDDSGSLADDSDTADSHPTVSFTLYCKFGLGFLVSSIYNLLIIVGCCYYAFRARHVPDNYNESKFIAVSVYSTLVLCLAVVPVYQTSDDIHMKIATLSLALVINAYVTLVCLYMPKFYIIYVIERKSQETDRTRSGSSFKDGRSSFESSLRNSLRTTQHHAPVNTSVELLRSRGQDL
ncbi:metabotropic glutamate receptor 4-like [Acanthaster planci]|uniref:Metabotropic glutamate receptor 4-like n=1 Tax=Acanthaster planci TaxID=133434 RepID=A0A8B7YHI2_ACAPL|nr:metabotropic glutamate receptor 4-like [Acanthaster planci]